MFGLIRFIVSTVVLAGMIWCGATVKLGKRTTFGHVGAIWGSSEGKDLRDGVKTKAHEVRHEVGEILAEKPAGDAGPPASPAPSERRTP